MPCNGFCLWYLPLQWRQVIVVSIFTDYYIFLPLVFVSVASAAAITPGKPAEHHLLTAEQQFDAHPKRDKYTFVSF